MRHKHTGGFAHLEVILCILVVVVLAGVGYFVLSKKSLSKKTEDKPVTVSNAPQVAEKGPAKIKNLGVNLDYYDPATNKAGDFVFTKATFAAGMQMLFMDYGYVIAGANSSTGQSKANPQPTFILPLGTKVKSLVDGVVYNTPKLYSGDYSVQVQGEGSDLIFETEHVINVKVQKGDKVTAGQVVAEVSDYEVKGYNGLGLVEIGILKGGNPPQHLCPFDYLDDSIKADTLKKITALEKSWEQYRGDSSIYDESKVVIPGCLSRDPIEG